MTAFEYKYRSYKKGSQLFKLGAYGEDTELLGVVTRQTKYSVYYISEESGREKSRYRDILNSADKYNFAK